MKIIWTHIFRTTDWLYFHISQLPKKMQHMHLVKMFGLQGSYVGLQGHLKHSCKFGKVFRFYYRFIVLLDIHLNFFSAQDCNLKHYNRCMLKHYNHAWILSPIILFLVLIRCYGAPAYRHEQSTQYN